MPALIVGDLFRTIGRLVHTDGIAAALEALAVGEIGEDVRCHLVFDRRRRREPREPILKMSREARHGYQGPTGLPGAGEIELEVVIHDRTSTRLNSSH